MRNTRLCIHSAKLATFYIGILEINSKPGSLQRILKASPAVWVYTMVYPIFRHTENKKMVDSTSIISWYLQEIQPLKKVGLISLIHCLLFEPIYKIL